MILIYYNQQLKLKLKIIFNQIQLRGFESSKILLYQSIYQSDQLCLGYFILIVSPFVRIIYQKLISKVSGLRIYLILVKVKFFSINCNIIKLLNDIQCLTYSFLQK
ncbi:transmembrane protein, putative (macronuclear) [Tetrahymena thermophila SB210]|uniref:Transmembrane protein, putative n=1 Tax=Tetrahymena thermophila (strain SB210) TaxID=312017 RepID=W7X8C5_TETTS|nr:transmembrane protein, putative [Tetrahymena thermophila SB210]EWS75630.1 transmembrane protein, putative [Tetrahymena thermophila SB210]|eukprot:XP_012651849.1 transmembrane protein, putative [Tetrahymena thermophila SB210]